MTGHEAQSVSKVEVEIPSDLFDLCLHLAKHAREEPLAMLELAAVMGLAQVSNAVQRECVAMQLVDYIETHHKRLGIRVDIAPQSRRSPN